MSNCSAPGGTTARGDGATDGGRATDSTPARDMAAVNASGDSGYVVITLRIEISLSQATLLAACRRRRLSSRGAKAIFVRSLAGKGIFTEAAVQDLAH